MIPPGSPYGRDRRTPGAGKKAASPYRFDFIRKHSPEPPNPPEQTHRAIPDRWDEKTETVPSPADRIKKPRPIGRRYCLGKATRPPTRTGRPSRNGGKTKPIDDSPPATGRAIRLAPPSGSHEIPPSAPAPNVPVLVQEETATTAREPDRPIQILRRRSIPSDKEPFADTGSGRRPKNPNRPRSRTPKTFRRTRPVRRSSKDTIAGTRTPASRQSLRGKTPPAKRRRRSFFFQTMISAGDFPPHPVGFVSERPCRRTARTGAVARPAGKPANDRGSRRRPLPQASHPSPTSCASHDSFLRSRGKSPPASVPPQNKRPRTGRRQPTSEPNARSRAFTECLRTASEPEHPPRSPRPRMPASGTGTQTKRARPVFFEEHGPRLFGR